MIERGILIAVIGLGLIAAISSLDVGQLFAIEFAPSRCTALQAATCS